MKLRCLVIDDDDIQRALIASFVEQTDFLTLSGDFESAIKASNYLHKSEVDIILLDVEMPEMSGIDLLNSMETRPPVILITSNEKYAVEAFDYSVTDYLVKPVSFTRFLKAVKRAKHVFELQRESDQERNEIFIRVNSILNKLDLSDILFIKAAVDYVDIYTSSDNHMINSSLSAMMQKLPKEDFIRVHRSFIVRIDKIDNIDGNIITVSDNLIRIGRSYKDNLMRRINLI